MPAIFLAFHPLNLAVFRRRLSRQHPLSLNGPRALIRVVKRFDPGLYLNRCGCVFGLGPSRASNKIKAELSAN